MNRAPGGAELKQQSTPDVELSCEEALPQEGSTCGRDWLTCTYYPALILVLLFCVTVRPIMDPDCWFHMAFGRYLAVHKAFPPGDVFSFTAPGGEWISSGWLSSLGFHLLYEHLGVWGLLLSVYALLAGIYMSIYWVAVRCYGNRGSVALLLVAAILASYLRFTPRPEIWSQLAMTALMLLLVSAEACPESRAGAMPRRLWFLPVVFLAWANLHAGFLAGLVVVAFFGAWKAWQWFRNRQAVSPLVFVPCALCFLTWMANPYGARLLALGAKIKTIPNVREHVMEWMPLIGEQDYLLPWPAYLGIGLVFVLWLIVAATRMGRLPAWHWVAAAGFVGLEFYERRHIALAAVVLVVSTLPYLGRLDRFLARLRVVVPALVLVGVVGIGGMQQRGELKVGKGLCQAQVDDTLLPKQATEFLRKNRPPGNLYNSYGPGGYLLYHLGPETKVFIDGRLDVYTPGVWGDSLAIQWDSVPLNDVISYYGLNSFFFIINDGANHPRHLAQRLSTRPDMKLVYFDDVYALFVRETPQTSSYTSALGFKYVNPLHLDRMVAALQNSRLHNEVLAEVERARTISGNSARSLVVAAVAAQATGDQKLADKLMAEAQARNPSISIARHEAP